MFLSNTATAAMMLTFLTPVLRSLPADGKGKIALANASETYGMIMSQFVIGMILSVMLNFKDYHTQQLPV